MVIRYEVFIKNYTYIIIKSKSHFKICYQNTCNLEDNNSSIKLSPLIYKIVLDIKFKSNKRVMLKNFLNKATSALFLGH